MIYKIELDDFDIRRDKYWIQDGVDAKGSLDQIEKELRDHMVLLENGILNQNDSFISFTNSFQELCFQYGDGLSNFVKANHINFFLDVLLSSNSFEINKQILDVLFILTKDNNIKIYLYQKDFINILFQLYQIDKSYFISICNIFSVYFINTSDEIHQQILNEKIEIQHNGKATDTTPKTKTFFKIIIDFSNDLNPENLTFTHSALFLISNIIINYKLSEKQLKSISEVLINRLSCNPQEVDLDDIIYCYCCLFKQYPDHIMLFSQTRVIWHFPDIFNKSRKENEFIGFLMFLQHLLKVDGTHISYFIDLQDFFSQIVKRISISPDISENCKIAALKAIYFGVMRIPKLTNLLIQDGILQLLLVLNELSQFNVKKISLQLLNEMLEMSDMDSSAILLNSQCVIDLLSSNDQFSEEFFDFFLKNVTIALSNVQKDKLSSINNQFVSLIEELALSDAESTRLLAQNILNTFFI